MKKMGVPPVENRMDSPDELSARLQDLLDTWRRESELPARSEIDVWEPEAITMVRMGALDTLEACVRLGMDINQPDEMGHTCLHVAADAGMKEVAEKLLDLGADPNARNVFGDTPLHTYIKSIYGIHFCELLVLHDINVILLFLGACPQKTGFNIVEVSPGSLLPHIDATMSHDSRDVRGAIHCLQGHVQSACEMWQTAMGLRWNSQIVERKQPPAKSISSILGVREPLTIAEVEHLSTVSRETLEDVAFLTFERVLGETWGMFILVLECARKKTTAGLTSMSLKLLDYCCKMDLHPPVQPLAVRKLCTACFINLHACEVNDQPVAFSTVSSVMSFSMSQLEALMAIPCFRKQLALRSHPVCAVCTVVRPALESVLTVFTWLTSRLHLANEQEKIRYGEFVGTLVRLDPRLHGSGILHLIPDHMHRTFYLHSLESDAAYGEAVQHIVRCSAVVHGQTKGRDSLHLCKDHLGKTPLHLLREKFRKEEANLKNTVQCFLDHGAHLCTRDNFGVSSRESLPCPSTPQTFLPLSCLAAKVCRRVLDCERLEGQIPKETIDFLEDH